MTITAKYPSRCAVCGRPIRVGDQIEWKKGSPAVHAACVGKAKAAAKTTRRPATTKPRNPEPPMADGEVFLSRPSRGMDDGYDAGQTIHATRIPGGGGPDGRYWTVTWSGKSRCSEGEDDTREGEWMCRAHARPATDAEVAPLVSRAQATELRKTRLDELQELCRAGTRTSDAEARRPSGIELVIRPGVHGSGRELAILTEDGAVALWCSGHYDDYRETLAVSTDQRAAELFRALQEES
jgi:hypothetical protein